MIVVYLVSILVSLCHLHVCETSEGKEMKEIHSINVLESSLPSKYSLKGIIDYRGLINPQFIPPEEDLFIQGYDQPFQYSEKSVDSLISEHLYGCRAQEGSCSAEKVVVCDKQVVVYWGLDGQKYEIGLSEMMGGHIEGLVVRDTRVKMYNGYLLCLSELISSNVSDKGIREILVSIINKNNLEPKFLNKVQVPIDFQSKDYDFFQFQMRNKPSSIVSIAILFSTYPGLVIFMDLSENGTIYSQSIINHIRKNTEVIEKALIASDLNDFIRGYGLILLTRPNQKEESFNIYNCSFYHNTEVDEFECNLIRETKEDLRGNKISFFKSKVDNNKLIKLLLITSLKDLEFELWEINLSEFFKNNHEWRFLYKLPASQLFYSPIILNLSDTIMLDSNFRYNENCDFDLIYYSKNKSRTFDTIVIVDKKTRAIYYPSDPLLSFDSVLLSYKTVELYSRSEILKIVSSEAYIILKKLATNSETMRRITRKILLQSKDLNTRIFEVIQINYFKDFFSDLKIPSISKQTIYTGIEQFVSIPGHLMVGNDILIQQAVSDVNNISISFHSKSKIDIICRNTKGSISECTKEKADQFYFRDECMVIVRMENTLGGMKKAMDVYTCKNILKTNIECRLDKTLEMEMDEKLVGIKILVMMRKYVVFTNFHNETELENGSQSRISIVNRNIIEMNDQVQQFDYYMKDRLVGLETVASRDSFIKGSYSKLVNFLAELQTKNQSFFSYSIITFHIDDNLIELYQKINFDAKHFPHKLDRFCPRGVSRGLTERYLTLISQCLKENPDPSSASIYPYISTTQVFYLKIESGSVTIEYALKEKTRPAVLTSNFCIFSSLLVEITPNGFTVIDYEDLNREIEYPVYRGFFKVLSHLCSYSQGYFAIFGVDLENKHMLYLYKLKNSDNIMKRLFRSVRFYHENITLFEAQNNLLAVSKYYKSRTATAKIEYTLISLDEMSFTVFTKNFDLDEVLVSVSVTNMASQKKVYLPVLLSLDHFSGGLSLKRRTENFFHLENVSISMYDIFDIKGWVDSIEVHRHLTEIGGASHRKAFEVLEGFMVALNRSIPLDLVNCRELGVDNEEKSIGFTGIERGSKFFYLYSSEEAQFKQMARLQIDSVCSQVHHFDLQSDQAVFFMKCEVGEISEIQVYFVSSLSQQDSPGAGKPVMKALYTGSVSEIRVYSWIHDLRFYIHIFDKTHDRIILYTMQIFARSDLEKFEFKMTKDAEIGDGRGSLRSPNILLSPVIQPVFCDLLPVQSRE